MLQKNNSSALRSVVFGCAGPHLLDEERRFFAEVNPVGFILFARNIVDPVQTRALVADLRASVGRADAPVMIDQEGGRVRRLRPPHWWESPPAAAIGALYRQNKILGRQAARASAHLIAAELYDLGIDVNCTPVLDLAFPIITDAIGNRAYGADPEVVADLGLAVCEGIMAGGVMPVIKHIPGHGRAIVDSHLHLPVVDASLETLREFDFKPFVALRNAAWGITAHILFEAIDPHNPATLSPTVIGDIIRGEIGFDGFLLTDDISMQAISGSYGERAERSLNAGCDAVLHCNGKMEEMVAVASQSRPLSASSQERLMRALAARRQPDPLDVVETEAQIREWLGAA